jgi:hypothetical protein
MTTYRIATADARQAGANVVHTVYVDGRPVATRRSQHRYRFAICHWAGRVDAGTRHLVVDRWSRSPKASGRAFAVEAVWIHA